MAVPSLQTRPGRNTKVQVLPSSDTFHRSAKAGCGTLSLSRRVKPSKIWSSVILSGKEVVIAGSRSDGSASNAYTTAFSCHTLSSLHPTRTRAIRHIQLSAAYSPSFYIMTSYNSIIFIFFQNRDFYQTTTIRKRTARIKSTGPFFCLFFCKYRHNRLLTGRFRLRYRLKQ